MTSIAALGSALVARTSRQLCSLRSAAAAGSTQRSQGSLSPPTTSATRARSDGPIGMPGVGPLWQSLAPSPTQLDKVVKMETFGGQTTEYIKNTWLKFHEDERKVSAEIDRSIDRSRAPRPRRRPPPAHALTRSLPLPP